MSAASIVVATQLTIGICGFALQPVWAQSTASSPTASNLFRVPPGDREFRGWLTKLNLRKPPAWSRVWQRALGMGASLEPFLAGDLNVEAETGPRLVLTGAYFLAARRADVVYLGNLTKGPKDRQRFMALFAHALGPEHPTGAAALVLEANRTPVSPLEQVAVCMAIARFVDRRVLPKFTQRPREVGVLAAALYCMPNQRVAWIEQRIKRVAAGGHEHLVWRGYLLGDGGSAAVERDRLKLALAVVRRRDGAPAADKEAAWYLAHARNAASLGAEVDGLSLELRLLLAHSKRFRSHILRKSAVPRSTQPESLQRRFVTLHVRWGALAKVQQALTEWKKLHVFASAEHRRALGLAVAWRLLTMTPAEAAAARLDTDWFTDPLVRSWLMASRGETVDKSNLGTPVDDLNRAVRLFVDNQLPRDRAAAILERELWRNGTHPGLAGLELHRQLLGELLIDGLAGTRFVESPRKPYIADGLERGEPVFQVAHELFKFIRGEEPWSMHEHRLQN